MRMTLKTSWLFLYNRMKLWFFNSKRQLHSVLQIANNVFFKVICWTNIFIKRVVGEEQGDCLRQIICLIFVMIEFDRKNVCVSWIRWPNTMLCMSTTDYLIKKWKWFFTITRVSRGAGNVWATTSILHRSSSRPLISQMHSFNISVISESSLHLTNLFGFNNSSRSVNFSFNSVWLLWSAIGGDWIQNDCFCPYGWMEWAISSLWRRVWTSRQLAVQL